jgi:hypothetical protein
LRAVPHLKAERWWLQRRSKSLETGGIAQGVEYHFVSIKPLVQIPVSPKKGKEKVSGVNQL